MATSKTATGGGTTSWAMDPGRVADLAQSIASGRLSPVALVERYLDRITAADPHVQCWRHVDRDRALALARERGAEARAGRIRGPLHGIPVAVKDIIDVEGTTTLCNSRSRANVKAATSDAEIVLAMRAAGAIPLGKVHTTEFAFFDPSPARNPHNLEHTPGGSSSGSAAAVAAGMAPMAIGTQTVASVNRPAAYCGISAFKPSTGSVVGFGISPLAPSFDTAGFYGFMVEDAVAVYEAIAPQFLRQVGPAATPHVPAIAIPEDPHLDVMQPEMRAALDRLAEAATRAGTTVTRFKSPIPFKRLFELQQLMTHYEGGRALRFLLDEPAGNVGVKILGLVTKGLAIGLDDYLAARGEIAGMRETLFTGAKADAFLWPAAPGTAPAGLASTGDPQFIAPWTALGGPIVTVPAGKAANGLPLGCLLAGRPGSDAQMCTWARGLAPIARQAAGA